MPTVNVLPTESALIDEGLPTTNLGSGNFFAMGYPHGDTTTTGTARTWLMFDIPTLPMDATDIHATLFLYLFYGHGGATYTNWEFLLEYCTNNSWDDTTITWNNAPNSDVTGVVSSVSGFEDGLTGEVSVFEFTGLDALVIANQGLLLSFRLKSSDEVVQNYVNIKNIDSHPTLIISYTIPGSASPCALLLMM